MTTMATTGAAGSAAPAGRASGFYILQQYYLRNSTQGPRIDEFMREGCLPALKKFHTGPEIFLEAQVAAHMPQFAVILGFQSLEEWTTLQARLAGDAAYQKAFAAWENGSEPPYEHYAQILLKATDYSPAMLTSPEGSKPRIFELRTYHSPTWKQLAALHRRFSGPEMRIFHRSGVHPILCSETLMGPNMPNLTYVIPFADLAAREKAWGTFTADPEWIKVRKESIDASGQISSVMQISLFRASVFSPIR